MTRYILLLMKRRLSVTNFSSENNLPTFRLNAPVVIRAKGQLEHSVIFQAKVGNG